MAWAFCRHFAVALVPVGDGLDDDRRLSKIVQSGLDIQALIGILQTTV